MILARHSQVTAHEDDAAASSDGVSPDPSQVQAPRTPVHPGDIERLTFFSDAAVAIALTLLILPVADYIIEKPATNWSTLFVDNPEIIQYAVSFATIVTCWRYHHVLFERLRDYRRVTLWLNFFWLFCIVSIPLLTLAVLPADDETTGDFDNVVGTLFVRGELDISHQNYFVYWFVVGTSFLALFGIARYAASPGRALAKPGNELTAAGWIFLRPAIVCGATALAGLFSPALGDVTLLLGIVVSVVIARRTSGKVGAGAD